MLLELMKLEVKEYTYTQKRVRLRVCVLRVLKPVGAIGAAEEVGWKTDVAA